jgi:hypothetical protein
LPLEPELKAAILRAWDATRRTLPPVAEVAARRNRRRLASLTRNGTGGSVLNLATAVVEAGEEAWLEVAPALEGDREALHRLRRLAGPGLAGQGEGTAHRAAGAAYGTRRGRLPPPRCEGTPEQRRFLGELVEFVRAEWAHALPEDLQLRISRSMTSALGRCTYAGAARRITIAERLFRPGLEDILWDTVKHELAHVADQATRSSARSDHGPRWKEWARRLGARPERLCRPGEVERIDRAAAAGRRGPLRHPAEVRRWLAGRRGASPASP